VAGDCYWSPWFVHLSVLWRVNDSLFNCATTAVGEAKERRVILGASGWQLIPPRHLTQYQNGHMSYGEFSDNARAVRRVRRGCPWYRAIFVGETKHLAAARSIAIRGLPSPLRLCQAFALAIDCLTHIATESRYRMRVQETQFKNLKQKKEKTGTNNEYFDGKHFQKFGHFKLVTFCHWNYQRRRKWSVGLARSGSGKPRCLRYYAD